MGSNWRVSNAACNIHHRLIQPLPPLKKKALTAEVMGNVEKVGKGGSLEIDCLVASSKSRQQAKRV